MLFFLNEESDRKRLSMSWLPAPINKLAVLSMPAPKALWGLVTSQESRDHVTLTLLYENSLNLQKISL